MIETSAAPPRGRLEAYWDDRARRFSRRGEGLAAVCSYGMPNFYNRVIELNQRLALEPWITVDRGTRVLDIGCGVGRWSRLLAARGALVTGVDLSPVMIEECERRASVAGVADRCRFVVQDAAELEVDETFDLILSVTVLQHILDPAALRAAVERMTAHLRVDGRMVLLEVAPRGGSNRCDSSIFTARSRDTYSRLFSECGLHLEALSGVDPTPFKIWLLPYFGRLPRSVAIAALALVTILSVPLDVLFGRRAAGPSWHAVFVLRRQREGQYAN